MPEFEQTIGALEKWVEVAMHLSMQNFIRYAKENNISLSQVGALFLLQRRGSAGVTDVGEYLSITSAAASQMLDRLVQQNLIERAEDPNDRRGRLITLTPAGQALLQDSIRARQSWMSEVITLLTPAEQQQVIQVLELLIEKSQQLGAQAVPVATD